MSGELTRRQVIAGGAAASAALLGSGPAAIADNGDRAARIKYPMPLNHRYLLSCKLSMIAKGEGIPLFRRLMLASEAGFDGVDLDEAGDFTPEQVREDVARTGVFVHNAINHDHWKLRLTSANEGERAQALKNLEHCIRISHAAGGSGVLLVIGKGSDGPESVIADRARQEIRKAVPLAAALGQRILFENVWNQMFYEHDKGPEQSAERWCAFVDSFNSPWVGMYHDIGNHWKYANPADWIRQFGSRAVKFDVKGFSRAENKFTDIDKGDLPWPDVRKALDEVGFTGWLTAEVGGGGLDRLKLVREQMAKALGVA